MAAERASCILARVTNKLSSLLSSGVVFTNRVSEQKVTITKIVKRAIEKLSFLPSSAPSASASTSFTGPSSDGSSQEDLRRLHGTMDQIRAILCDADERNIQSDDSDLKEDLRRHLLSDLIEVAHEAEDVIDEYQYEVLLSRFQSPVLSLKEGNQVSDLVPVQAPNELCVSHSIKQKQTSGKEASELCPSSIIVPIPIELAVRLKRIIRIFVEITEYWPERRYYLPMKMSLSDDCVGEPLVHGRGKEKEEIVQMLLSKDANNTDGVVSVLVITGIGGLGKTTVAKLAYNDPRVRQSFDFIGWVHVGINFDIKELTREILVSFCAKEWDHMWILDNLQQKLMEEVKEKRFLLVLDDVWNEREDLWRQLQLPLNHARPGVVVVTTRSEEVARVMRTMPLYRLNPLHFDYCWSLFKDIVFAHQHREEFANLLAIGEKIVRKCAGLPLAVRVLGNAFRHNSDEAVWLDVLESELWEVDECKMVVLPALKLSYDQMPSHLKQCFLIFSLFPKDFIFIRENIVKLWLALDFVEPKNSQPLEEIANNYFMDFVRWSFIMRNAYGTRENGFLMHDLMHDLAQYVAGEEFTRADAENLNTTFGSNSSTHSRYISVIVNNLPQAVNLRPLQEYHQLRLLQIINRANKWNNCISIDLSDEQFQLLRHLRILDLRYTGIEALPNSIGNLRQLRYLNLTKTNISKLPESISYLFNLETLELRDCSFRELPQGITNLVNLRHLNFFDKNTCMPRGIGRLLNLKTLPVLNIKSGSWHCEISELKGLVNLQGELTITGLRNVPSTKGAYEANLQSKRNLQSLTLDWSEGAQMKCNHYDQPSFEATNSELEQVDLATGNIDAVLENLQPNIGLKELSIINYFGHRFPKWLGDISFSQLAKITLNGCGENCQVLPTLGLLPSLKSVYVLWMHNIQFIGREFCSHNAETKGFGSLETLEFKYMPNWVQWFGVEDGEFCRLQTLRIVCCNQLQSLPQFLSASLTNLLISNCKELSVLPFLPSLTRLTLSGELTETLLYNLTLPSLKFLKIGCSENITSLLLSGHKFPSIEVLVIKGCKYLETIVGISSMTSLKRLEIVGCRFVQIYSNEDIPPSLQHLIIVRCYWLREWHQVISIKYRDQLNRRSAANNSLKALEGMRKEDIDYEMIEETGHYVVVSKNDIKVEKRPRNIIEEEQVWLEAKRRKENTVELGDSSHTNLLPMDDDQDIVMGDSSHRNLLPMDDDQDIVIIHKDQLNIVSAAINSSEALEDTWVEVSYDEMIVEERETLRY